MMYRRAGVLLVIATEPRLAEVLEARQPAELLTTHFLHLWQQVCEASALEWRD